MSMCSTTDLSTDAFYHTETIEKTDADARIPSQ